MAGADGWVQQRGGGGDGREDEGSIEQGRVAGIVRPNGTRGKRTGSGALFGKSELLVVGTVPGRNVKRGRCVCIIYVCTCVCVVLVLFFVGWGIGGIDETALKWIGGVLASCILHSCWCV